MQARLGRHRRRLIHVTADGGLTWRDVTPPGVGPWPRISLIDAGRFNPHTAYAAVNTIRLDDMRPHIYRTHDGGANLDRDRHGHSERRNRERGAGGSAAQGLLFAGTERAVYVSFDDGARWQPLKAQHGRLVRARLDRERRRPGGGDARRGFWILDDITPLRQIDASSSEKDAILFERPPRGRVRLEHEHRHAVAKEEPTGRQPPDAAIINYYLKSAGAGP